MQVKTPRRDKTGQFLPKVKRTPQKKPITQFDKPTSNGSSGPYSERWNTQEYLKEPIAYFPGRRRKNAGNR